MNKRFLFLGVTVLAIGGFVATCIFTPKSHLAALLPIKPAPVPVTSFDWAPQIADWVGSGQAGWLDGDAKTARFSDPYGIVADHQGNVFVSDAGENNKIRKISVEGVVSTFAGSTEGYVDGIVAKAKFNTPSGLALDADGNIYVADTGNNVIRKITPNGTVSTLAGSGVAGYLDGNAHSAQFNGPISVAVDKQGNVLVADTYNDRIRLVSPAGQVRTLAGSGQPGFQDGAATMARFDTPCAVAVNGNGEVIVADAKNNALRVIGVDGQVSTVFRSLPEDREASFIRPVSIVVTPDNFMYVGVMMDGAIFQFAPGGAMRMVSDEIDPAKIRPIRKPYGLALTEKGEVLVSDAPTFKLKKLTPRTANGMSDSVEVAPVVPKSTANNFPWPLQPQHVAHEIVGTMGEDRGNDKGEGRDHFHAGLDVRGNMGTQVLAVMSGKVNDPLAAWGYGNLSEGVSIGLMNYIHMRVGRDEKNAVIDATRFTQVINDKNKPVMRVKRGARFVTGDVLGTVNRMFHVHLEYHPFGVSVNPLVLGLQGYTDNVVPHIDAISLIDKNGSRLAQKDHGRLQVAHDVGNLAIVVDAYDQMNGNESRRRLGLYQLGYQVLNKDGRPLPGFELPQMNIEFNTLPDDDGIKIAYLDGSGETVHGNKVTKFLYVVTNLVRDGVAQTGYWNPADLPRGDYLVRIYAADFAGNVVMSGRDLAITIL